MLWKLIACLTGLQLLIGPCLAEPTFSKKERIEQLVALYALYKPTKACSDRGFSFTHSDLAKLESVVGQIQSELKDEQVLNKAWNNANEQTKQYDALLSILDDEAFYKHCSDSKEMFGLIMLAVTAGGPATQARPF